MSGGCELELFICAFGSSKSHHRHADVSFQMCEEHLNLPSLNKRCHVHVSFTDITGDVACCFTDRTNHISGWLFRTAICLQWACVAVVLRRSIFDEPVFAAVRLARRGKVPAICPQFFVVRAHVAVGRGVNVLWTKHRNLRQIVDVKRIQPNLLRQSRKQFTPRCQRRHTGWQKPSRFMAFCVDAKRPLPKKQSPANKCATVPASGIERQGKGQTSVDENAQRLNHHATHFVT